MTKVLIIFGTRPEAIKMAPVIQELGKHSDRFILRICSTGQHRHMLDHVLDLFGIKPDYELNIMQANQSLGYITSAVLIELEKIIEEEKPDYVLVQGDTTTVMASCLAAFYQKVKIGHIEAGLRTWDKSNPYPEEANRKIADSLCDLHFVPTEGARQNLLREGIPEQNITVTGNTVIDALFDVLNKEFCIASNPLEIIPFDQKRVILVTAHRRENLGQPLENICHALRDLAESCDDIHIVYPVHLNPNVWKTVYSILDGTPDISLIEPLDYQLFVHLINRSYIILTDSGGLQEEAPSLGKPVLVLREKTERPEAVKAGTTKLVGTNRERIKEATLKLLEDEQEYYRMARTVNPYGDGKASQRIVACLLKDGNIPN